MRKFMHGCDGGNVTFETLEITFGMSFGLRIRHRLMTDVIADYSGVESIIWWWGKYHHCKSLKIFIQTL